MAPANRASIAEGPALKLVHCTLTCGPMALSKNPLALPTMACACVMLGNAPTRMVLTVPWAHPETAVASQSNNPVNNPANQRLLTLAASDHHGEDAGGVFLLSLLALAAAWAVIGDQIGEGGV